VTIEQGVSHGVYWLITLIAISIVPVFGFFRRLAFEGRRWKDSMYSSAASSGSDDSDDDSGSDD